MASVIRVAGLRQASHAINRGLTFMLYNISRRWTTDVKKEHGSHPVDEKLFFRKIPVEQKGVKYEMTVMDTGQTQPEYPVVLLIHGAPGGSIDFVNLIPFLLKEKLRIIAPNFPGYGVTNLGERELFHIPQSTEAKADIVIQMLKQLNINSVQLLISHSQGSMTAYKICAEQDIKAAAFINATGYYPQRPARPLWLLQLVSGLFRFAPTRRVLRPLLLPVHQKAALCLVTDLQRGTSTFLHRVEQAMFKARSERERSKSCSQDEGFTGTDPSAVETALRSVAAAHFHKAKEYGAKIAAKKLPVLFALSKSDKIVECGRALDLLKNVMAAPNNCIVSYDENRKPSHHLQTEFEDWYVRTLVFQTGGHLVHKAHQDIVTDELTRLLRFIQHNH